MYDYQYVLKQITKSDKLKEELEASLDKLAQNGQKHEESAAVLDWVVSHYQKFHPSPLICETGKDGVITHVNKEFAELAEYEPEEMIGQNINILRSSKMEQGLFTDLWNHLSEGRPWQGQLQNRTKNLSTYWVDTLISPVFDENREVSGYWSLSFDISGPMAQQEEVEHAKHDIEESLRYAKRIQKTILPDKSEMDEVLEDYFVLYKPKDIVSGDFYWFVKTVNKAFLAVVDCTGHGVPGAFMSLIGYNLLNQIVLRQNIHQPGEILSELHRQIRQTLKQDQDDSKSRDGMDVSLVVFDRYGEHVEYAGAFRPLYWWNGEELIEIKGDKMSIGGEQLEDDRIFTNNEFEVDSEQVIYMFSDGIVDQFGGPEGKKFSTKRLKNLITQNHHESMSVQRALFNLVWKEWKGDDEQIDDVTMMGVRF